MNQFNDISSFSVSLATLIIMDIDKELNNLNLNLGIFQKNLDMNLISYFHFYSLIISWKILTFGASYKLQEPIKRFNQTKPIMFKYFMDQASNDHLSMSISLADLLFTEFNKHTKET